MEYIVIEFSAVKKGTTYYPPSQAEIRQFVQAACQRMGEQLDSAFDTPEMRSELTTFLTVVSTICAKYLTREACRLLDKDTPHE